MRETNTFNFTLNYRIATVPRETHSTNGARNTKRATPRGLVEQIQGLEQVCKRPSVRLPCTTRDAERQRLATCVHTATPRRITRTAGLW